MNLAKYSLLTGGFLVGLVWSLASSAAENPVSSDASTGFQLPAFQFLRQNEDWSGLATSTKTERDSLVSDFKFISLSKSGSNWLSIGGHLRGRLESWDNFAFGSPAVDEDRFGLGRALVHADFHFGENFRVFVETKTAFSSDRDLPGGNRTLDVDEFALQQAFMDFGLNVGIDSRLTVRVGRQALLFGNQRLASPLPWGNTLRAWDGLSVILQQADWSITGFWTQFAPVRKFDFNQADAEIEFFGAYASGSLGFGTTVNLDVYLLGLDRSNSQFNGLNQSEQRYTAGTRLFGVIPDSGFDYELELAHQFGDFGDSDIDAAMITAQLGYRFSDLKTQPRVSLGLDYASGDDSDEDLGTFNQLFPLGHAYLGLIDTIGRQNIIDASAGISLVPATDFSVAANVHYFWRASDDDALYNAGGAIVRIAPSVDSSRVGTEIDLTVRYTMSRNSNLLFGYSYFIAEDFIEETGVADNTGFVYLQSQYTF